MLRLSDFRAGWKISQIDIKIVARVLISAVGSVRSDLFTLTSRLHLSPQVTLLLLCVRVVVDFFILLKETQTLLGDVNPETHPETQERNEIKSKHFYLKGANS